MIFPCTLEISDENIVISEFGRIGFHNSLSGRVQYMYNPGYVQIGSQCPRHQVLMMKELNSIAKRAKGAWRIVIVQVSNAAVRDAGSLSVDVYRTTGKKFL